MGDAAEVICQREEISECNSWRESRRVNLAESVMRHRSAYSMSWLEAMRERDATAGESMYCICTQH